MQLSRRSFFTYSAGGALALVVVDPLTGAHVALADALPGGTLAAADIRQFASPLLVPPTMPRTRRARGGGGFVDESGAFLPHLLPVDPTLHWANPSRRPGTAGGRDPPALAVPARFPPRPALMPP